jgi:hypothetical protein
MNLASCIINKGGITWDPEKKKAKFRKNLRSSFRYLEKVRNLHRNFLKRMRG